MKVFILSSGEQRASHSAIQDYLQQRGVAVWLDAAVLNPNESYLEKLLRWLNDSDLVILLASANYLEGELWSDDWEAAKQCSRAKLIVRLEPVELPETLRDCTILDCYDHERLPHAVHEFIQKRKRMRVFVSYSRANIREARHLVAKLERSLNRIWIDSSGLEHGEQFPARIHKEIEDCDCFVLLWSRHSRQSRWVEKEWNLAFKLDNRIIPVILDKTALPMVLEDTHAFTSVQDDGFRAFFDIPQR